MDVSQTRAVKSESPTQAGGGAVVGFGLQAEPGQQQISGQVAVKGVIRTG